MRLGHPVRREFLPSPALWRARMGRFHGCRLDKTGVPALRRKRRGLACGDINFSSGSSKRDGPGACMRGGCGAAG